MINLRTSCRPRLPCRHWKIAECSESTGTISAPHFWARSITNSPAQTKVSLLAKAMRLPESMAASVGLNPAMPTIAVTTASASGTVAASKSASAPPKTLVCVSASRTFRSAPADSSTATTSLGLNFLACSSANAVLEFTVSAATEKPQDSATSRV